VVTSPTIVLFRWGGLGDVLMALAAAKAVKLLRQARVVLLTQPTYHPLATLCPFVDAVVSSAEQLAELLRRGEHAPEGTQVVDLNPAHFGLDSAHQVDAYLRALGLEAPPILKELRLDLPAEAAGEAEAAGLEPGARPVLLHAALGDPNRTWPEDSWRALVAGFARAGHRVVLVGSRTADEERGVHELGCPEALDLVDRLSLPGLVALLRRAALFVTTDSGPLQLAGASPVPIVGIYSVVSGRCRLPYRQGFAAWRAVALEPDCPHAPCYRSLSDWAAQNAVHARFGIDAADVPARFSRWCLSPEPYRCLAAEIRPDQVLSASLELVMRGCDPG
jgi:ADP-heptose:LPS heptosyltransferase